MTTTPLKNQAPLAAPAPSTPMQSIPIVAAGLVLYHLDGDGVAHVRMNRPDEANGLNIEHLKALRDVLLMIHGDARVRAVLLSGAGRHFCAGGDVHTFYDQGEQLPDYIRGATLLLQQVVATLMRLNAPVVAAVQGYAAGGGGLGLVCSSDFVVAARSAQFLAGATRVAMVPDAGVSVTLTHLVGFRRAMDMLLLNPTLSAEKALEIGLISSVVADEELHDRALELARRLAAGAPAALAATKRLLWNGLSLAVEAAMPAENQAQAQLAGMADAREGLLAVIEKRTPHFTGR